MCEKNNETKTIYRSIVPVLGGILSIFLMGVHDPVSNQWRTVTKGGGFDDKALDRLQKELEPNLDKINKVMNYLKLI